MSKVLSALGGALPDERPLLSLQIVESLTKCPTGYFPVNRTYDEDSDAGLIKQNGLFGKKSSHYICLSKSEGVPGYVLDGVVVVGERETAPPGFSVAGRAGKRRLCTRLSRPAQPAAPPLTDVIVCSKMRHAPAGFMLAGEINGKMVCYKVSGGSTNTSPTHNQPNYENVGNTITPEVNRRLKPGPPKLSPLISELNGMNLKQHLEPTDDYETLSITYVKPARPAPRPPSVSAPVYSSSAAAPPPARPAQYLTLGGYCGLDGVPFLLNPKLRGVPSDQMQLIPVVSRRTKFDLDKDYSYNFSTERQA